MKKGFSLAEMLVTIGIIGVVAALTLPIINAVTDNYKPLYKSAFQKVESIVNELINDVSIYPAGEFSNGTFCSNFFNKVNTIGTVDCATSTVPGTPNAITTNGMRWYLLDTNFGSATCPDGASGECIMISVDLDGTGGNNADDDDILDIYLFKTGKITVPSGSVEEGYLID